MKLLDIWRENITEMYNEIIIIIGIHPLGWFGQRPELYQSGDWYSSGTLHPRQVLRG